MVSKVEMDFHRYVQQCAHKQVIYTLHAFDEMNAELELITTDDVRAIIFQGNIIEEYPEDKRGHSCLMCGKTTTGRVVHVVCAPKGDYLAIITAYVPSLEKWEADLKTRKKR